MLTIINTRLGENRGVPRVWLEGQKLCSSFEPGQRVNIDVDADKKVVLVKVCDTGRFAVSQRNRNGKVLPLIEIKDNELANLFGDAGVLLRVVIRRGVATIEAHGIDRRDTERTERFESKIATGQALAIGSLFSGGGIIDSALHAGLSSAGVPCFTKFIVEQESQYLESMVANQPELFTDESILIESGIEFVELKAGAQGTLVDILVAGIPCTGASRAGRTKNKIAAAEFHDSAGACFFYALNFIGVCQPAVVILENVPDYLSSTSFAVIQSVLTTWGYNLSIGVMNGNVFGSLEDRDRMVVVATSKSMKPFEVGGVEPIPGIQAYFKVADVLEDVPLDSDTWRSYSYLADKEIRDKEAGKGFKRCLVDGSESKVPTIRRLYHKAGSTDTYVKHPDGLRSRLFTPIEHARLKGIPERLIAGLSNTVAHEVLGQSVCYPVFVALGTALGQWAKPSEPNLLAA